jgi:hypothetical protein
MWTIHNECIGPDGLIRYLWIPNFGDAYVVGDDGSVWSRYKGIGSHCYLSDDWMRLRSASDTGGYLSVILCFNRIRYKKLIHQLVCEAIYGGCPVGLEVCHNDGNAANNWYWNLRYDTKINNHADKVKHGTHLRGENSPNAISDWTEIREIRAKYHSGKSTINDLVLEHQLSKSYIKNVIYNLTWVES